MSRWAAFAIVAAFFMSGIAIGALGMHVVDERHAPPSFDRPPHPRAVVEHLGFLLELSDEQREEVAKILERSWRAGEEIRREIQPRVDRHIDETERQLREILTPVQRERFDALHRRHDFRKHRLFLGPPGFPAHPTGPEEKPSTEGY